MEPAAQEERDLARAAALVRWLDGAARFPLGTLLLPWVLIVWFFTGLAAALR